MIVYVFAMIYLLLGIGFYLLINYAINHKELDIPMQDKMKWNLNLPIMLIISTLFWLPIIIQVIVENCKRE